MQIIKLKMKDYAVARRKFRKLNKKEIQNFLTS
jgi:hypothetical protein